MFNPSTYFGKTISDIDVSRATIAFTFADGSSFTVRESAYGYSPVIAPAYHGDIIGCTLTSWAPEEPFTDQIRTLYRFNFGTEEGVSSYFVFSLERDLREARFIYEETPTLADMWTEEENHAGPFVLSYCSTASLIGQNLYQVRAFDTAEKALAATIGSYKRRFVHFVREGSSGITTTLIFIRKLTWIDREGLRAMGVSVGGVAYTPLPWDLYPIKGHFAHHSVKNPAFIAFTESAEKGVKDIQTAIRPGRYLKRFYPEFSDKEILRLAEWFTTGLLPTPTGLSKLDFATTPEAIESIYAEGPESCMSGEARSFGGGDVLSRHPASVYGAGDLAVAYMMKGGKVIARAVVWPEKKVFRRAYPTLDRWKTDGFVSWDDADAHKRAFIDALAGAGYSHDEGTPFIGARLLAVREDKGWLMPYVDGSYGVRREGGKDALGKRTEVFVLCSRGETSYDLTNTDGIMVEPYDPWWWEDMDSEDGDLYGEDPDRGREAYGNLAEIAA